MTGSKIDFESNTEAAKLKELCSLVLHRADVERDKIIDDARSEINMWIEEQQMLLDAECDAIAKDAGKRASEISTRQTADARSESNRERLKLHNKCVNEARAMFQKKLESLRGQANYKEILAGLAIEAVKGVPKEQDILFRLSAADAELGEEVAAIISKAESVNVIFDPSPGEFNGGVMVSSADGRWSVVSDWRAKTEELADTIAERILAVL